MLHCKYAKCFLTYSSGPVFSLFFSLAFGVAHQAVEEVDPTGDTILVQGVDFVFHE